MTALPESLPERFRDRVRLPEGDGCWIWTGFTTDLGYGFCKVNYRRVPIHRVIYEEIVGPIPEGLTIDHLCRVRNCVNPNHLEPVTNRENILRGIGITAQNARKTLCPKGHSYSGANLIVRRDGGRICRTCKRAAFRAWRQRRKSEAAVLRAEAA